MPNEIKTQKVPAAAFDFLCPFEMVDGDSQDDRRGTVRILARSGEPVDHWYWGPIVHDFAGMRHKPKVALDWLHCQEEPVGFVDQFNAESGDLVAQGEIVSVQEGDQAAKILAQGRAGIPFEASIKFGGQRLRIEEIQQGITAAVNGRELAGPLTIVREWDLRGIAVCLYGYDPHTQTALSQHAADVVEVAITKLSPEVQTMPDELQDDVVDQLAADQVEGLTEPKVEPVEEQPDPKAELKAKLTDYVERFGKENGTEWALANKPLDECWREYVAEFSRQHAGELESANAAIATARKERDELQGKLDQLSLGEETPVSSTPAEVELSELSEAEKRSLPTGAAKYVNAMRRRAKAAVGVLALFCFLACSSAAKAQALMPRFERLDAAPSITTTDVFGFVRSEKPYQITAMNLLKNIDAGASGTAGSVDVFPSTASKGKLSITAADSAGDTTTTIVNASQAGARTYTIPDAGASASFVMTAGAQTIAGAKTFGSALVTSANVGAVAGTGVTLVENGDGTIHQTVFTLTAVDVALTDEAGVIAYGGLKIYDAPEGMILVLGAVADVDLTKSSAGVNDDWDGDFAIGTATAGNDADLTSTEADILPKTATPQAAAGATTSNGQNAAVAFLDGTTTAKDVYVNFLVDDADHDVTSTACNLILNGTITLTWIKAGDY